MKKPLPNVAGCPGPRRPYPPRVQVLDYRLTRRLPNGSPPRTCAHASILLGGDFILRANLVVSQAKIGIEMPMVAYDEVKGQQVEIDLCPALAAAILHALASASYVRAADQAGGSK